jgi:hypothetical protein
MKKMFYSVLVFSLFMAGCSDKEKQQEESLTDSGMKCGAGKCGASMVNGNSIVEKKKKNILSQMKADDSRKDCVLGANTTKALYNCLRDPKSGRVSSEFTTKE